MTREFKGQENLEDNKKEENKSGKRSLIANRRGGTRTKTTIESRIQDKAKAKSIQRTREFKGQENLKDKRNQKTRELEKQGK